MNKKLISLILGLLLVTVVLFVFINRTTPTDLETNPNKISINEENLEIEDNLKENAKEIIGEVVTQDDVKKSVGEWNDFEMSSEGCERGVYAGRFFYDDFTIFSKTYDKGKTFHIESINEK